MIGGTFVGVFMGHALIRSLIGTGQRQPVQAPPKSYAVDPCAKDSEYLAQCIEASSNNLKACQYYMDALTKCQSQSYR